MTHRLTTNYDCNRTLIVKVIVENVVTCFLGHGVDIPDVITCFKFGDDRLRGLASAEGQILPFPIDFDGCPYNTLTLPCERVISQIYSLSYACPALCFL